MDDEEKMTEEETVSKDESKNDKFRRIAAGRTNKILSTLTLLGNCSNRILYEYTDEEVDKIFDAIQSKLDETKTKFQPKKGKKEEAFSF